MADAPMSPDERAARQMIADDKAIAMKLAEQQGVPFGKTQATPEQEDELYWLRDPSVDEHALRGQTNPQTGRPYTEAEIAYAVFPKRRKLIYTGTRALDLEERVRYVDRMQKRRDAQTADAEDQEV